jgi:hypothetical protein
MSFAYVIRSRKVRDWVVLAAFAIMMILIAAVFCAVRQITKTV